MIIEQKSSKTHDTFGKRVYLPFTFTDECPECERSVTIDLTTEYLSYPALGTNTINFYHWDQDEDDALCDHEWNRDFDLAIVLTPVQDAK